METLLQSTNLVKRAFWLIKLRWIAVTLLAAATFIATNLLDVTLSRNALYILAAVLVVYNFVLFDILKYLTWNGRSPSSKTISRFMVFQISADIVILTTILHFSGGIENPFFFFYVFHMIIASIILSRIFSYIEATFAVALFGLLVLLEYNGSISHYTPAGFVSDGMYKDGMFVLGTYMVFAGTLYLVVYMTTSITVQLKKQQDSYEQANRLLEQKDHLKNEYVLRVTHDIRGHLAAIESCLNIVGDEMVGPLNEKQADLVQRAFHRAAKCMAFITALLKLTRMKLTGRLEKSRLSLKNSIFNVLASAENSAARKSIKVTYEIEQGVDEVYGEQVLIEEAVANILLNAIKYSSQGGSVKIIAKNHMDGVLVEISDTGIGIPQDELEKVFEEFYRSENARKIERDGTGLGLSIARQVIERHGGRIWAQNNPTEGSTFSFILPAIAVKAEKNDYIGRVFFLTRGVCFFYPIYYKSPKLLL